MAKESLDERIKTKTEKAYQHGFKDGYSTGFYAGYDEGWHRGKETDADGFIRDDSFSWKPTKSTESNAG